MYKWYKLVPWYLVPTLPKPRLSSRAARIYLLDTVPYRTAGTCWAAKIYTVAPANGAL